MLRHLAEYHRDKMTAVLGYNGQLAPLVYGGSDMFLMPSLFEPCGLGQMIAMRYGSVPVVRATGGLADTVFDGVSGFTFHDYSVDDLWDAMRRAIYIYWNDRDSWRAMQQTGHAARLLLDHVRARLPAALRMGHRAPSRLVSVLCSGERAHPAPEVIMASTVTASSLLDRLHIKDVNPGACTGPDGWITDPDGHELISHNPTTGAADRARRTGDRGVLRAGAHRRDDGVRVVPDAAGATPRRARAGSRQRAPRAEGAAGRSGQPRDGQDPRRRPRRSAGDDRHLRLRGRPVPAALRPDAGIGTARATA